MAAQRTRKNTTVCRKNPIVVGHPPESDNRTIDPKIFCVILNVSGFAIKKNIRLE
jgi:hypothetical protein